MAKVVTLYIDDTSIRLLVANGKRVEKWAHLPLEPGLVSDGVIVDEEKVAAKIKELLKAQRVNTKKVAAALSGLNCLTRPITLPQLPKELLAEAVTREAERILPVPLMQLYISWQIIPTTGEEMQVFLAASLRNAADALIKTLRRAGLDPYIIDLKPLALARVANKPTAIIVDAQPTELDIIIMVDGIPQPVRGVSLPSKASTLSEKLPSILEELERTIKFYNTSHSEKPLDPSTPIFVSGELAQEPEACQSLASTLKYPVLPISPPLECPDGLDPSQYMTNIGLALKGVSPTRAEANFSAVNLNALPEVYKPKPIPLTKIIVLPITIIIAIGLLASLVMRVQSATANTASLRSQLDTINQQIKQGQVQKQNITELEKKVNEVEASRNKFNVVIVSINDQRFVVNSDLKVTTSALPKNVNLSTISHASNKLTISGMAPSEVEVLVYAKNLRTNGRFSRVIISTMEKTEEGMSFTLTLLSEG